MVKKFMAMLSGEQVENGINALWRHGGVRAKARAQPCKQEQGEEPIP